MFRWTPKSTQRIYFWPFPFNHCSSSGTSSALVWRIRQKFDFVSFPAPRRGSPCWARTFRVLNIFWRATWCCNCCLRSSDICAYTVIELSSFVVASTLAICRDDFVWSVNPLLAFFHPLKPLSTQACYAMISCDDKSFTNFSLLARVQILQMALLFSFKESHIKFAVQFLKAWGTSEVTTN